MQSRQRIIQVSHFSDAGEARRVIKTIALELGFDTNASEEMAIVASELATNLVKHAVRGQIILTPLEENGDQGIEIESQDEGPGFNDVEQAISDGYSTTGSLGYGLGTVNRLMDQFDIHSKPGTGNGTIVTCRRWKRNHIISPQSFPLSFGIATRARGNKGLNGDDYVILQWNRSAMVAVIDGLGHGKDAQTAAQAAREYVKSHYDQSLGSIFRGASRACRATRGVVMSVARFDFESRPIKLHYAGVGNIETRVFDGPSTMRLAVQRGVVGLHTIEPAVTLHDWDPEHYVLVMHSDGLTNRWHWDDFPELHSVQACQAARMLLYNLASKDDDATVIVVKAKTE